jgi:acetyl esterase
LSYWDHYLGPDGDPASPDASPMRAASLAGLPPAYVLTVEYDVLRDEGEAYARALRAAGVPVRHRRWDGHLHGFLGDPSTFSDAEPALAEIATAVRVALTPDAEVAPSH